MKQLHKFLKVFLFAQLGAYAGRVLQRYLAYRSHPEIYEFYSAPWYTGILITLLLTVIMATITAIAYLVVGHLLRKRGE